MFSRSFTLLRSAAFRQPSKLPIRQNLNLLQTQPTASMATQSTSEAISETMKQQGGPAKGSPAAEMQSQVGNIPFSSNLTLFSLGERTLLMSLCFMTQK